MVRHCDRIQGTHVPRSEDGFETGSKCLPTHGMDPFQVQDGAVVDGLGYFLMAIATRSLSYLPDITHAGPDDSRLPHAETPCRTVTRSVSFEVALFAENCEDFPTQEGVSVGLVPTGPATGRLQRGVQVGRSPSGLSGREPRLFGSARQLLIPPGQARRKSAPKSSTSKLTLRVTVRHGVSA